MGNTQSNAKESLMSYCDSDSPYSLTWEIPKTMFLFCFTMIKLHNHSKTQQDVIFESKNWNRLLYYFTDSPDCIGCESFIAQE